MMDRLLMGVLRMTIIGLITGTAGAALMLSYHGLLTLLARQYPLGSAAMGGGVAFGIACYCLIRNGDDLMDR